MENPDAPYPLSILLVDDDQELCGMMREFIGQSGHRLECAHDGPSGLSAALSGRFDLIVLDVMLPVFDGMTLLQQLRRRSDLPVIMLTARVQQQDRIHGLNTGADDYLPKPFDPDELLARIYAILRRTDSILRTGMRQPSSVLTIGDLQLNTATREASLSGNPLDLTAMELDLLELLMRSAGRIVSRNEISLALFEREATPYDRFLDVHISNLRKKLEGSRSLIKTIRGVGYEFTRAV